MYIKRTIEVTPDDINPVLNLITEIVDTCTPPKQESKLDKIDTLSNEIEVKIREMLVKAYNIGVQENDT